MKPTEWDGESAEWPTTEWDGESAEWPIEADYDDTEGDKARCNVLFACVGFCCKGLSLLLHVCASMVSCVGVCKLGIFVYLCACLFMCKCACARMLVAA